ncbi:MAG: polysaccharide deacetylase family protein [Bacteroidales bacterium]|jgi:peptidoglycan/xylan/chitin deacetylase (PgdA/CDA1 family)|nr:polysaccharide deacetylase family protein [Bacteroidales bacterium]
MRLFRPFIAARWLFPKALFRIISPGKTVCLTFDDGPHPESTPQLLKILDSENVRAVFFCSGEAAEKYPGLINEIRRNGHLIGNHGYYHFCGWRTSAKKYFENAEKAAQFTSSTLFRPPYGRIRLNQYQRLKKQFRIVFWDIMSFDFDSSFGADRSLHILKKKLRPGSIIVLHDTPGSNCRMFLQDFIKATISKGYRFCISD